jgi:hypothetical protein
VPQKSNPGWSEYLEDARSGIASQKEKLLASTQFGSIDAIQPLLLAVVLIPGDPLAEYGAGLVEYLLIEVTGKTADGTDAHCVGFITRMPYGGRTWDVSSTLSAVHVEPPFPAFMQLPKASNPKTWLMSFIKRAFAPGIGISTHDIVCNAIVFEDGMNRLIGDPISDSELENLFNSGNSNGKEINSSKHPSKP